jgi:hypothetical protein
MVNLLFSSHIDINEIEYDDKPYIILYKPSDTIVSAKYTDDSSFLNEIFFNLEPFPNVRDPKEERRSIDRNSSILFLNTSMKPNNILILPKVIDVANTKDKYIFSRYVHSFVKETDYKKIKPKVVNRILELDPYNNNIVTSVVDGRLRGFGIDNSLQFSLYNNRLTLSNLISKPSEMLGGSGYISRVLSQDCKAVHMPYSGYFREVGIFNRSNNTNGYTITSLKFNSNYFMPPSVSERDYGSVIFGNYTNPGVGVGAGSRGPDSCYKGHDFLKPQPRIRLTFYVIIINKGDYPNLTNAKLVNVIENLKNGGENKYNIIYPKAMWMQQGEQIGMLDSNSSVIILFNRKIEFASDIKHFSIESHSKRDCLLKLNDVVGELI